MSHENCETTNNVINWLTDEHVKKFLFNYGYSKNVCIKNYVVQKASDKMLGYLADYWKVKVCLSSTEHKNIISFFIKAISQNASKAKMVREINLFEKETNFYNIIKNNIEVPGIKPWSAKLVFAQEDAIVFEDLNSLGYESKNKFETFDNSHTKQALQMLARFHACSIIYEDKKRKLLQRPYTINEDFEIYLDKGGYYSTHIWFVQCMKGALATIQSHSKYKEDDEILSKIESNWEEIWSLAMDLSNALPGECNVVCHRDLWNNNILFRYKTINDVLVPDDCVMVDFQAVRYQPLAGDVMLLLYCNLEPNFREENMDDFLRSYYEDLALLLSGHGIRICDVLPLPSFLRSAEKQRLWGLVVAACLLPQIWIDDDLATKIFCDDKEFNDIVNNNKASFIKKMLETSDRYRIKVMQIFEEIVEKYCLP